MSDLASLLTTVDETRESRLRQGKVTAVAAGPPRTVTLTVNGTSYTGISIMDHVDPVVNEGVFFMDMGVGRWVVVGNSNQSGIRSKYMKINGDTTQGGQYIFSSDASSTTAMLSVPASTHVTSERASLVLGDWILGQDSAANGTKDWFISNGTVRISISAAGVATFAAIPLLPASNPTTGNEATRKTYVDAGDAAAQAAAIASSNATSASTYVAKTGNQVMSGSLQSLQFRGGGNMLGGVSGGSGAVLLTDSGGNNWHANWTGTVLNFYVDAVFAKTFVINHPLFSNKYLVHACAEGPTADVFYRGEDVLGLKGLKVVRLPEYFEALTELKGRTVQLTAIGSFDPLCASPVFDGAFSVNGTPGIKFYWRVDAVRKGTSFAVEPNRSDVSVRGNGPYTYIV